MAWLMGLSLTTFLLMLLVGPVQASGLIRYVVPNGSDPNNACLKSQNPCETMQHAVDMAGADDEIRVATGTYTGVGSRGGLTQTVYIDKNLTIRGGCAPRIGTLSIRQPR